jgi:hypothetical protein
MDDKILRQIGMIGADLCALGIEASVVVWLRTLRLASGGPEAATEAGLMVGEKIAAQQELAGQLFAGRLGASPLAATAKVTRHFLKGVRANRRRLSQG